MGDRVPGVAVCGVILPHGAPLPLGQVWAPALPVLVAFCVFIEAELLGRVMRAHGGALRLGRNSGAIVYFAAAPILVQDTAIGGFTACCLLRSPSAPITSTAEFL